LNFEEWLSLTEIVNELNDLIDKTIDEVETDSEDEEEQTEQNPKNIINEDKQLPIRICPQCKKTNFLESTHCDQCNTLLQ